MITQSRSGRRPPRDRKRRRSAGKPDFTVRQILDWADAQFERTGCWPKRGDGPVLESFGEKWSTIDDALRRARRGLSAHSSLARLLHEHRGVRNKQNLPPYDVERILAWADAHQVRAGDFPSAHSGPIAEAPGETWLAVEQALVRGRRGFAAKSSLAKFLAEHRGHRNRKDLAPYTIAGILAWADAHRARTGKWPYAKSGPIADAPGETWAAVDAALDIGARGMPGRTTLAQLLAKHRGARNRSSIPRLTVAQILTWGELHRKRHGKLPSNDSGPIFSAKGESWQAVDIALRQGLRALPEGSSLARLWAEQFGARNGGNLCPFTIKQILAWADAYHRRHGRWPSATSGPIDGAPGESWSGVREALYHGQRGLPGGSSLARLLGKRRGVRNRVSTPRLTMERILAWVEAHYRRTGTFPSLRSGAVSGAPGETWLAVNARWPAETGACLAVCRWPNSPKNENEDECQPPWRSALASSPMDFTQRRQDAKREELLGNLAPLRDIFFVQPPATHARQRGGVRLLTRGGAAY